jgi:hypothetical protein
MMVPKSFFQKIWNSREGILMNVDIAELKANLKDLAQRFQNFGGYL